MTVESTNILNSFFGLEFLKAVVYIMLTFYVIFALLITRQVELMGRALITPVSPLVKAVAIIHAGFAIGLAIFIVGTVLI